MWIGVAALLAGYSLPWVIIHLMWMMVGGADKMSLWEFEEITYMISATGAFVLKFINITGDHIKSRIFSVVMGFVCYIFYFIEPDWYTYTGSL